MNDVLVICAVCAAFISGFLTACRLARTSPETIERFLVKQTREPELPEASIPKVTDVTFAVARSERKPTWRQRRKQLEAAARKERERIEAWRG